MCQLRTFVQIQIYMNTSYYSKCNGPKRDHASVMLPENQQSSETQVLQCVYDQITIVEGL